MLELLQNLNHWDWLALAAVLLILEVFGTGGYLLWAGLAAALVAGLKFLIPELAWTLQLPLYGVLAILTAVYRWKRQRTSRRRAGSRQAQCSSGSTSATGSSPCSRR